MLGWFYYYNSEREALLHKIYYHDILESDKIYYLNLFVTHSIRYSTCTNLQKARQEKKHFE